MRSEVIGMDPSLTSFGVAYKVGDRYMANALRPKDLRGYERLAFLEEAVEAVVDKYQPSLVAYEDYAMGGVGRVFHIGELGGVIKMLLLRRGIDILCVPPTSLKLFTTGKGGGKSAESKQRVAVAVQEATGQTFKNSDEYDATALLLLGESYLNARLLPRNRKHYKRKALAGCSFVRL